MNSASQLDPPGKHSQRPVGQRPATAPQAGERSEQGGIAVVIPCYRVARELPAVVAAIGSEVSRIYCVDDACPEGSGTVIARLQTTDTRVVPLYLETNQGVGGATIRGIEQALADGAQWIVKLDGDGQMDPALIPKLIAPLQRGEADYTKGNRFFHPEDTRAMPLLRLIGNAGLSFFAKLSTGYWQLFDPNNGFVAIEARVARAIAWHKLHRRYFFESDVLFRLSTLRAVVRELPMRAHYGAEASSLNIGGALIQFPWLHARNFFKRIGYNYFLRDFSIASASLLAGLAMTGFGLAFGLARWWHSRRFQELASAGTVMLAALPILLGVQLLLNFLQADMANVPRQPIHPGLRD